jgi:CRISPR-associated protein Cas1
MLNYGYGILYSKVERALVIAGLDPYIGLLHCDNYNKKSFVFDFIEPYRILIDEPVFYIFSRHKFEPGFIEPIHKGVVLTTEGKKFLAPLILEHFDTKIRYHNKNRKRIDMIRSDAHAFANFIINRRKSYLDSGVATRLDNFLNANDIEDEEE